jgi:hypothetical protein
MAIGDFHELNPGGWSAGIGAWAEPEQTMSNMHAATAPTERNLYSGILKWYDRCSEYR